MMIYEIKIRVHKDRGSLAAEKMPPGSTTHIGKHVGLKWTSFIHEGFMMIAIAAERGRVRLCRLSNRIIFIIASPRWLM